MARERIYYVPGLISLLGLPILLAFFGPGEPNHFVVARFGLASDLNPPCGKAFTKKNFLDDIRHKKVITVDIRDDSSDVQTAGSLDERFQSVNRYLDRLVRTEDTNSVLQLRFGEKSNYGQFVWAVNAAAIHLIRQYALLDNDFYFVPNRPIARDTSAIPYSKTPML